MLIGSFNACSLDSRIKNSKVKYLITLKSLEFLAVQETKVFEISTSLVDSLWENPFCDWSFSPSIGNSRDLLSTWCNLKGSFLFSFASPGYLRVCLKWGFPRLSVWSLMFISSVSLVRRGLFRETHFLGGRPLRGMCGVFWVILILFVPPLRGLVAIPLSTGLGIRLCCV